MCASLIRIERALQDGDLPADTSAAVLTKLIQAIWDGLSVQASLGTPREDLLATARLAGQLICGPITSPITCPAAST
ncbi:hypothetical protein [Nocardia sp. NPDC006630]|uniref:hypothetical protein n=1 Tax=Nocardia sp. NPDC006630 TaxID=3157181 RepID=UPI0033A86BE1